LKYFNHISSHSSVLQSGHLESSNTRGHSRKIRKKPSRLNVRKYTFTIRIVEIWNSLPESVIQAKTVKQFEIGLDEQDTIGTTVDAGLLPLCPPLNPHH
jgi:hypothetical protein